MATSPSEPGRLSRKVRIDTRAVDGVRGFAVFHIVAGHLLLFSNMTTELQWKGTDRLPNPARVDFDASSVCPEGWGRIGGMCFAHPPCWRQKDTWRGASEVCAAMVSEGHIMSGEQRDMAAVIQDGFFPGAYAFEAFWTGLNEIDTKNEWKWSNGSHIDQARIPWLPGEPNDHEGPELCAAGISSMLLMDIPCEVGARYVCSVKAKLENCQEPCGWRSEEGWNAWPCEAEDAAEQAELELARTCGFKGLVALKGGGSMGLFYIISGFVMAVGYCQEMLQTCCSCGGAGADSAQKKLSACDFYWRRLVRLAPTYFLTNAIGIVMREAYYPGYMSTLDAFHWVTTSLGLTSWFSITPVGNALTWTISTMLFFYLLFPILAPAMQRLDPKSLRPCAYGMYLLQAGLMHGGYILEINGGYWVRMVPPVRLPVFIMGICAGLSRVHAEQARADQANGAQTPISRRDVPIQEGASRCSTDACIPPWLLVVVWVGLTGTFSTLTYICSGDLMNRFYLEVWQPILFFEFILAVTSPANDFACVVRFFRSRPMRFLGDISMCAYMIHMLVAEILGELVGHTITVASLPWWSAFVVIPCSILLGWMLTEFFEKPIARCLRPDKHAAKREDGRTPKESAPSAVVVGTYCADPEDNAKAAMPSVDATAAA